MTRDPRTVSVAVMVVLVVFASGAAVSLAAATSTNAATGTELLNTQEEETDQTEANITINEQRSDGEQIVIESVTMSEGGFVAIHDQSLLEGDVIDSVRGNSVYLEPGTHENVTVTLAEPINESQSLIAMPHLDTNDNQVYDFVIGGGDVDGPYTSAGEAVIDQADVTVGAPTEEAQPTEELVFQVEEMNIDEWSFIIGDSTEPDRTVRVSDVTLRDQQVDVNLTELLMGGTVEESVSGTDQEEIEAVAEDAQEQAEDAQEQAEDADTDAPSDIETVRVVLSDVTVENVTFTFEVPRDVQMPAMPGAPEQPQDVSRLSANVTFENQTTSGETVTVDSVSMSEGGFVVVHDRSLLDGNVVGSVVGASQYLEPGTHEDVTVRLEEPIDRSQVLIAMPHLDTNGNQVYDFSKSDGQKDIPYVVDNQVVIDPALVSVEGAETTTPAEEETTTPAEEETTTPVEEEETTTPVEEETTTPVEEETTTPVEEETTTPAEEETTTPVEEETTTPAEETTTPAEEETPTPAEGVENVSDLGPSLDVMDLEAPLNATVGETLMVNVTVTNPTDQELTQPVDFRLDGDVIQRKNVTLGPGESTSITYEVDTSDVAPGTYTHGVYTRNFGAIAAITLQTAETTTPAEETTTPAEEETTTPAEAETTTPVEEETTTPVEAETTTPVEEETTTPVEEETTTPIEEETTTPVEAETTTPVAEETTTAVANETAAEETTTAEA
ncbi:DUF7282 domain-containing protein [Halomicrococcus sp. NG-SE-24]|uniref:DUF7282 domain-containing protein n=1 Tax=Halomicrococcus sp. NG-SE-24 TaxID=3436928 RepID=UPI003D97818B